MADGTNIAPKLEFQLKFRGPHISRRKSILAAADVPVPHSASVFQKSDAKIQISITMAYLIRIKYPLSSFNYHLSDVNVANFAKIHRTVSKQQLF